MGGEDSAFTPLAINNTNRVDSHIQMTPNIHKTEIIRKKDTDRIREGL